MRGSQARLTDDSNRKQAYAKRRPPKPEPVRPAGPEWGQGGVQTGAGLSAE